MTRPPPLPETWPGHLGKYANIFVAPVPPDTADSVRARIATFDGQPDDMKVWARKVVDIIGVARVCPRPQCRRAGECRSKYVACFIELREGIRELLAPAIAGRGE